MRRIGGATRMALSLQLLVNVVLGLAAAFAAIWLVARPGVRLRVDLTEKRTNSLSTATEGVLAKLEAPLVVDVFWRGEDKPLDVIAPAAMDRVWRLLQLIAAGAGDRITVQSHQGESAETIQARLRELKLRGYENCVVVSNGDRREVVPLRGGLVEFDTGDPRQEFYRPPAIRSFPAEEALVEAILQVTRGEEQRVYFTVGQGERRLDAQDERGLATLARALESEAIECVEWDWQRTSEVPVDCDALAILAPDAAFPPGQMDAIVAWIDRGGRAAIAAHEDPELLDRSDVPEIFQALGMEVGQGVVMNPARDSLGNVTFDPAYVVLLAVGGPGLAAHPINDPLRTASRSVILTSAHPVFVRRQPESPRVGASVPLLQTDARAWLDLPPLDYEPRAETEAIDRFTLAAAMRYLPDAAQQVAPLEETPETRVVALGTASPFENGRADRNVDFATNVFRWLTATEWRVSVSTRDPDERRIPPQDAAAMASISRFVLAWVPLACLALGVVTAILRGRGGPKRATA